jgi:hypothetical protein
MTLALLLLFLKSAFLNWMNKISLPDMARETELSDEGV